MKVILKDGYLNLKRDIKKETTRTMKITHHEIKTNLFAGLPSVVVKFMSYSAYRQSSAGSAATFSQKKDGSSTNTKSMYESHGWRLGANFDDDYVETGQGHQSIAALN